MQNAECERMCVLRQRTKFPDLTISAVLCRSSVEYVKPLGDSMSEAVCIRQYLACGEEAYKVRNSICVGATNVLIGVTKFHQPLTGSRNGFFGLPSDPLQSVGHGHWCQKQMA